MRQHRLPLLCEHCPVSDGDRYFRDHFIIWTRVKFRLTSTLLLGSVQSGNPEVWEAGIWPSVPAWPLGADPGKNTWTFHASAPSHGNGYNASLWLGCCRQQHFISCQMHDGLPAPEAAGVLLHKDSSDSLVESTVSSGRCPGTGVR